MKFSAKIVSLFLVSAINLSMFSCAQKQSEPEELIDSPELLEYVASLSDEDFAVDQENFSSVDIGVRNNSIVYSYTYISKDAIPDASTLSENLDSLNKTIVDELEKLRAESGCDIDSIIIEYIDPVATDDDGNPIVIASKTYSDK